MAEQLSGHELADYYRARLALVREQVQLGLPMNDPEERQMVLDFTQFGARLDALTQKMDQQEQRHRMSY